MNSRLLQAGQSTIEFIVASLIVVPLFLIVPLLGKYIDLAQTTQIASRYVAFEGAVHHSSSSTGWKTDAELATEVRRRFYSRNNLSVKTGDVVSEIASERNPLWVNHRANALLPSFNQITVHTAKAPINTLFNGATRFNDLSGNLELPNEGLYSGSVSVQIANVAGLIPLNNIGLSVTRRTVVLADPWAAKGPNDVVNKVNNSQIVLPTAQLKLAELPLGVFISIAEPNASPPKIGKVEPDWVPADRLKPYKN